MKRRFLLCACAAAGVLAGCMAAGGDATETGNARVTGVVRGEDGRGVVGAEVIVLPADFNPVSGAEVPGGLKAVTDAEGRYRVARLNAGEYNVLAFDPASRRRLSVWGVRLDGSAVEVPDDTLRAPGSLSVPVPENAGPGPGWIFVPGTLLRARIDSASVAAGRVLLDSVPAGRLPSLEYAATADSGARVLARGVEVRKAEVSRVDAYAAWPHARRLSLNTAAGDAAFEGNLRDFPLLVRLSAPDFDFSQAGPGGADLRVSAADGSPLSREIETWDPVLGRATLWVRLDTLRGGEADQHITLHWGSPSSAGPARSRPVFDTAAGFGAVLHLDEEARDTSSIGLYKDATGAGGDGDDHVGNPVAAGAIGAGQDLDSGDYIVSPRPWQGIKSVRAFTLSAWFRAEGKKLGSQGGELLSVGDNFGLRVGRDSQIQVWYWPPNLPATAGSGWNYVLAKAPAMLDGQWHFATGTFDGSVLRLYIDGAEIGSEPATDLIGMQFPLNVTLGRHGNGKRGFDYVGEVDEAQVHTVARDSAWAKLSFVNQRPGSRFPAFGP